MTTIAPVPVEDRPRIAARRGWQTLLDALIAVLVLAAVPRLVAVITAATSWTEVGSGLVAATWPITQAVAIAGLTAMLSWYRRRYRDGSGIVATSPDDDGPEPRHAAD